MRQSQSDRYRWIPWVFVGAMAVVVAVNGGLVYFAIREPVGIIVKNPYQDGLRYNEKLAERREQAALGWQVAAAVDGKAGAGPFDVRIEARDRSGSPLSALSGKVRFERPVERLGAIETELTPLGNGQYVAAVRLPRPGQWELTVDFTDGTAQHSSSTRISVR
ncbi:MAG: FixH family protein [Reyranellaceae bacterium]